MQSLERLPILTARSILEFIQSVKSNAAFREKGWFTSYSGQLKQANIKHTDTEIVIQETSNKYTFKRDWTHLNTRLFQAEMGICHKFQLMQTMFSDEDSKDTDCEVERLKSGILDINRGVLSNLSVIHQVLVGNSVTNLTEKGLLEMWSMGIYDSMSINLMSAKRLQDYAEKYLDNAAILQLKGILLFIEANTNSRFCSQQLDLFEQNLKYQVTKNEKTVPKNLKYLTNPDDNKGFYLRPVFDGKDEPFLRSQNRKHGIGYDYMCGYTKEGMWFFEKSTNFEEDGSLLISGRFKDGKCIYISVSDKHIAECVSEKHRATPFDVIPLDFSDDKLKIIICKSNAQPDDKPFLGNSLTFIDDIDESEFTLTFDKV